MDNQKLRNISKLVRYYILEMTTKAGSGHMTSSLSAVELMVVLYFSKLRFDLKNPKNLNNDRVIFSKGHASPLFYALYALAGELTEDDLYKYRKFGSKLEGHPMPVFEFAEVATGSLGQGLSVGVGMAIGCRKLDVSNLIYVLLGDSEMSEGSVWEAMNVASYYQLDNLVAILDVNRLGQRGETMFGCDTEEYQKRAEAFGWETFVVDGHNLDEIVKTFEGIVAGNGKPKMIIAKTIKGKGVPFAEDKEGWHARVLKEEELKEALFALGDVDKKLRGTIEKPEKNVQVQKPLENHINLPEYKKGEEVMTRKAYGESLAALGYGNSMILSLDGEVKNSTFANDFEDKHEDRFFEMFIAEQNMVGAAIGLAKLGFVPFVSTFSAFMTRAYDQIRMAAYSEANVKFIGSHSGVSIGADGPSQMGLEEIALFRSIWGSNVFFPSDAVSCAKLVEVAAKSDGIFYIGTLRSATAVIYGGSEAFKVGGSKVLRESGDDKVVIVACGISVHEALKASELLIKKGISVAVVDAYSIKPIDEVTILGFAKKTGKVVTVEDHYSEGGLGDAVLEVVAACDYMVQVYKLAVTKMPKSGKPDELMEFEGIDHESIVKKIVNIIG